MKIKRHKTKVIQLGDVAIGGSNPISIQSMTKTDTKDVKATVRQIHRLEKVGCEIVRVSVPDLESAQGLTAIISRVNIPVVADIHFNWQLAVKAIEAGAQGIRINPGNIGGREGIKKIVKAAEENKIPIRIGVNSGSLPKKWLNKYGGITPEALVASALEYIKLIESFGFQRLKISIKVPDVIKTIQAYCLIAKKTSYPLHIGVTEAGPVLESSVRSSMALGALLRQGIGDTIRVSVTGDPVTEVIIAQEILQGLGLRNFGPYIISCPTCARCGVNLVKIVNELKKKIFSLNFKPAARLVKVAVMGCVVNGPGEAKDVEIGIACGPGNAVLFRKGKLIKRISEQEIVAVLLKELEGTNALD